MANYVKQVATAIAMAAPAAVAARFENFNQSVEISACAIEVFAQHGIPARLICCGVFIWRPKYTDGVSIGATSGCSPRHLHQALLETGAVMPAFEEWEQKYVRRMPNSYSQLPHLIVEAGVGSEFLRIDLNLGHLRSIPDMHKVSGAPIPMSAMWSCRTFPYVFQYGQWALMYMETDRKLNEVEEKYFQTLGNFKGLLEDLTHLTDLATKKKLHKRAFAEALALKNPMLALLVAQRLAGLSGKKIDVDKL